MSRVERPAAEDPSTLPTDWKQKLRRRGLNWFGRNARDLPWRASRDPYRVWVSEIMLQQTQVATVIPYFQRFMQAFPEVRALAKASEEQVLRHWEGLGYYRRARQMHRAAQMIVAEHGGRFPATPPEIRALPGIGRYTAGAIASIAFNAREPILEANTIRLFSRLLADRDAPHSAQGRERLWTFAREVLPRKNVGTFNQALMEIGSQICTPRDPSCDRCPLAALCPTCAHGWQTEIPAPRARIEYEAVNEVCVVVHHGKKILLRKCREDERWAGLWDFPRFPLEAVTAGDASRSDRVATRFERLTGLTTEGWRGLTTIKHGVTRYRITLDCFECEYVRGRSGEREQRWVDRRKLDDYPLSVTGRKIADLL